jgi:predicted CXXCH cytochrome family protein
MTQCEKFCGLCIVIILCFILAPVSVLSNITSIRDTKHNLSGPLSRWPGKFSVRALDEREICIFCHTPHNATAQSPLWNHLPSAVTHYIPYWNESLQSYDSQAAAPPVDGVSRLCLSCHDGTVAVGAVNSKMEITMDPSSPCIDSFGRLIEGPGCTGYVGTDLSRGHPISIIFDDALAAKRNNHIPPLSNLNYPADSGSCAGRMHDPDVKLYLTQGGCGVQCTSCHDPHGSNAPADGPPFWRKPTFDQVCVVCHQEIPPYSNITW